MRPEKPSANLERQLAAELEKGLEPSTSSLRVRYSTN